VKWRRSAVAVTTLACITGAMLAVPAAVAAPTPASKHHPPPPPPPPPPPTGTFVTAFGASLNGSQLNLTPEQVQPTSDGGYIALAGTETPTGGAAWLVKFSATGIPQWQEGVGCSVASDSASGVSAQQTADGGYVVAGGTVGCGSGSTCPPNSGLQCALVEKFDPAGKLMWADVYNAGPLGSAINQIRQTADGGYVAVGSTVDAQQNVGAMILKLDGDGNVQWQDDVGPAGADGAYFNAVEQTAGGGYVATGDDYTPTAGGAQTQVLLASFDANGGVRWQRGMATTSVNGAPNSGSTDASSIVSTSDGGFAIAGIWNSGSLSSGGGPRGALLLKFDAGGNLQWQQAYSGSVYCFDNGISETCTNIGAVAYSVLQTSDGGYVLAGDGDLELLDETPLVPWQAKTDSSGNLSWQHFYYQAASTGRPLSEYFATSAVEPANGFVNAGLTENYTAQRDEVYVASTDSSGLVGSCSDVQSATPLETVNPGLIAVAPALPVQVVGTSAASSPVTTFATTISTQKDC